MHNKESSGSWEFVVFLSKQTFQWDFISKWLSLSPSAMTHYDVPSPRMSFSRSVGDNSIDRRSGCPVDQGLFAGKKSKPAKGHQISCKKGVFHLKFQDDWGCMVYHVHCGTAYFLLEYCWLGWCLRFPGLWEVMVGPTVFQKFRRMDVGSHGDGWWKHECEVRSPVICIISLYNLNWCRMLSRIHQLYLIVSGYFKILPTFLSLEMHQGLIMKVYIDTR